MRAGCKALLVLTDLEVNQAGAPVATRAVGEALGLEVGVRGRLEPLRGPLSATVMPVLPVLGAPMRDPAWWAA
nr:hypothetical protein OG781_39880 [Streptomyces sp. NBC_00830]